MLNYEIIFMSDTFYFNKTKYLYFYAIVLNYNPYCIRKSFNRNA